jgi:hypothetical protein
LLNIFYNRDRELKYLERVLKRSTKTDFDWKIERQSFYDFVRKGEQGAIIEDYQDGVYEVEFTNRKGETTAMGSIHQDKFTVVWCAKTEQWLTPVA